MSITEKISFFNRKRKWDIFLKEFLLDQETRVLDVGFSDMEYRPSDNFIEKYYPYPEKITALGIDTPDNFTKKYPKVKAVRYDGGVFPFGDKEFDICWSNAVIEHVGSRDKQLLFLKEIKRVSKKSFVTTPNRFFPVEIHTHIPLLHYLPKKVFDKFLILARKRWAAGDYMRLLSFSDVKGLLREAGITPHKIYKNRILGLTLDFTIIF